MAKKTVEKKIEKRRVFTVTGGFLNIRREPSMDSEIIGQLPVNEKVEGELDGDWVKTERGYLKADFLK